MGLPHQEFAPAAERVDQGRSLRSTVPRSSHAAFEVAPDRADPVETLQASNEARLPELVPIRFGRMSVSPFAFLRGSAAVMAADLAHLPDSGLQVQACGDCHLMNFGMFATPERHVVFGLNDFDETLPGPWEWDLKRLAASLVVAGRDAGTKDGDARASAVGAVRAYRTFMWEHSLQSPLEVWYDGMDVESSIKDAPDDVARARRKRLLEKARRRVGESLFPKLVRADDGGMRIVDQPPLLFHPQMDDLDEIAEQFIAGYRESLPADRRVLFDRYRLCDLAVKVVGVGSVGTRCLVGLFSSAGGHPLFLQIKEANASVLEPYVSGAEVTHNGERVVTGQRLMQAASDIFLGWATSLAGRHFYVRQLRDMKLSVTLTGDPVLLGRYAEFCGQALARAHANSGDAACIAGYMGRKDTFDEAIGDFAVAYADQTERDHALLVDAIRDGRVDVIEEAV